MNICNYYLNGQKLAIEPTSVDKKDLFETIKQYLFKNYQEANTIYNNLEKEPFTQQKREEIPNDQVMDYIADYVSKNFNVDVHILSEEDFYEMVGEGSQENAFVSFGETGQDLTRPTIYIKKNSGKDTLIHELLHIILEVGYQLDANDVDNEILIDTADGGTKQKIKIGKEAVKTMVNNIYEIIAEDYDTNKLDHPLMDLRFLSDDRYKDLPFEQKKKEVVIRAITACITSPNINEISNLFNQVFNDENEMVLLHLIKRTFGINNITELEDKTKGLKGVSVKNVLGYTINLENTPSFLFTYNSKDQMEWDNLKGIRYKAKQSVMIDQIIADLTKKGILTLEC